MDVAYEPTPIKKFQPFDWEEIARIPIQDNQDPIISLKDITQSNVRIMLHPAYFLKGVPHATKEIYVRLAVAKRLLHALNYLPQDIGLMVFDGLRNHKVQSSLRLLFKNNICSKHPELNNEQIEEILDNFVANPDNNSMPLPHGTGGSVDVSLFNVHSGHLLDMGTSFDDASRHSYTNSLLYKPYLLAPKHRMMLLLAMTKSGFTNLPTEWWHFDYGNQNWAFFSGANQAIFDGVQ